MAATKGGCEETKALPEATDYRAAVGSNAAQISNKGTVSGSR